jgi:hypothetical protein
MRDTSVPRFAMRCVVDENVTTSRLIRCVTRSAVSPARIDDRTSVPRQRRYQRTAQLEPRSAIVLRFG